ncbi:16S rRNA (cytosine(1402)-N(4))-methyltransferase RsmH [Sharpea azabuensis]|uniref:16S rRNA (cytosine(1402)-N(4))-methyltransferase RsmH n=1 Tax=Sharpea azabuensis TaxID=322505 RepID=UPI000EE80615|nr:16S rRNA (cytosine(1402)-N(4))-methyltransferase RsmH [Sharpea azabuensis]MEE3308591.1 16S rRNA (cytosine(1402)-N(4))-methyltransferase RsmH [Sharpea azabuensis]HBZ88400.1 16S rRNA (cytosine(1402)-N(4))-methyltransferase [Erysipelotrichaceae bacterium]HCJ37749.1 16S rRNA (cytosine(1402)-N(4))-methyltransferase [Erysipelotrichaceae bacterium]
MFKHKSVLLNEAIESLNIKEDGLYVDCTLGGGGHSEEILKRLTTGHLYCFDQDDHAIEAATTRLQDISDHFTIINSNFVNIKTKLHELGVEKVDGVLYDLGVSSPQFDEESRGFSYRFDGPLDMRMNQHQSLSAYDVVNNYSYSDLVRILYKYGDEKFAKSIARHIEQERAKKPIQTTFELVEIVKQAIPARARRTGGHPAKRTFQAIRIEVNDELNVFEKSLNDALSMLNIGGRVSVITFQSLEDKIAKYTFNEITSMPEIPKNIAVIPDNMQPRFKKVTRKPITATEAELQENYRSHSAKLRVVERVKEDEKE